MKYILSILALLLATSSHAQRYRLVADTSYDYDYHEKAFERTWMNTYAYNPDNAWCGTDPDELHYDTMYQYSGYNKELELRRYHVRLYRPDGQLAQELWYEPFVLSGDGDSQVYYHDGAFVLIRKDSFCYQKDGRISASYSYNTTSEQTSQSTGMPGCLIIYPYEYKIVLRSTTRYTYKGDERVVKIVKVNPTSGWGAGYSHFIRDYDARGRLVNEALLNMHGDVTKEIHTTYSRNSSVSVTDRKSSEIKLAEQVMFEPGITQTTCRTAGNVYACNTWHYKEGKPDKHIYDTRDTYTADNLIKEKVYKVYFSEVSGNKNVEEYRYNSMGYIKELHKKKVHFHKGHELEDDHTKTTYTYEAY